MCFAAPVKSGKIVEEFIPAKLNADLIPYQS